MANSLILLKRAIGIDIGLTYWSPIVTLINSK